MMKRLLCFVLALMLTAAPLQVLAAEEPQEFPTAGEVQETTETVLPEEETVPSESEEDPVTDPLPTAGEEPVPSETETHSETVVPGETEPAEIPSEPESTEHPAEPESSEIPTEPEETEVPTEQPDEVFFPEENPEIPEETEFFQEEELSSQNDFVFPGTEEHFSTEGASRVQEYRTQDGKWNKIYWTRGVTPPSMAGADSFHNFSVFREAGFTHYQAPFVSGKGYYDLNKTGTNSLCYLGAASNLIYWWLDQNRDYVNRYIEELQKPDSRFRQHSLLVPLPDAAGWEAFLKRPEADRNGSMYYNQKLVQAPLVKKAFTNNYLLDYRRHEGYYSDLVMDFFFNGYNALSVTGDNYVANVPDKFLPDRNGGFFFPVFGREKLTTYTYGGGYDIFKTRLRDYLVQGKGVALGVMAVSDAHAITLWGVEYDDCGELVRIYATDTDDFDTNVAGQAPTYSQAIHTYDVQVSPNGELYLNNRDDKTKVSGYHLLDCYTLDLGREAFQKAFEDPSPVPAQPEITLQPRSRSYHLGSSAEAMTVRGEVSQEDRKSWAYVQPQWYEASDINGSNPRKIQGADGWSYTPELGTAPESRFYFCRLTTVKYGNLASADSAVAEIRVTMEEITNAKAPTVRFPYRDYTVPQGEDLYLSVNASSPDGGALSYQWLQRDFDNLSGFVPLEGANESTLKVPTDRQGKFGYKCRVTNTNPQVNGNQSTSITTQVYQQVLVTKPKPQQTPLIITGVPENLKVGDSFIPGYTGGSGDGGVTWQVSGPAALQADGSILITGIGEITLTLTKAGSYDYGKAETSVTISVKEDKNFTLAGANMILGNTLNMCFYVNKADVAGQTGMYATIRKTYADGRPDVVETLLQEKWISHNSKLLRLTFRQISAKEMSDKIYVQVFHADGTEASAVWEDSIRDYATRMVDKSAPVVQTMMVDMLNYGSEAQKFFHYNEGDLANSRLSAEQKAHGTVSASMKDGRQKDAHYVGTSLSLSSQLLMVLHYKDLTPDMYAEYSYTDHMGRLVAVRVNYPQFVNYKGTMGIHVDRQVVADCRKPVTCRLYSGDGTLLSTVIDSMESYAARMSASGPLYESVIKFSDASHAYLHQSK